MKPLVLLLLACCAAFGQWSNVARLSPADTITVERKGGVLVRGHFVRATEDEVTVHAGDRDLSVPRVDVVQIGVKRKGHAKWWGAAIGGGAGAAFGGAVGTRLANESLDLKGAAVGVLAAAGALIGLAIGAALDSRHTTIYRG